MPSTPPTPNDLTRQQLDELDTLLQRMLNLPLSGPTPPLADLPTTPPPLPDDLPAPLSVAGWRTDTPVSGTKALHLAAESPTRVLAPAFVPVVPLHPVKDGSSDLAARWSPAPNRGGDPSARRGRTEPSPEPPWLFGPPTPETGVPPSTEPDSIPFPGTVRGVDAPDLPIGFAPPPVDSPAPDTESPVTLQPFTAVETPPEVPAGPRVPVVLWPLFVVNWLLEALLGLLGPIGTAVTHPAMKHVFGGVGVVLLAAAGVWTARGMGWVSFPLPFPR